MRSWTHKVVKKSRGMNGHWFAHPTAATFCSFDEACQYAREFHAEQQESLGVSDAHRYNVIPRRADGRAAEYRLSVPASRYAEAQ